MVVATELHDLTSTPYLRRTCAVPATYHRRTNGVPVLHPIRIGLEPLASRPPTSPVPLACQPSPVPRRRGVFRQRRRPGLLSWGWCDRGHVRPRSSRLAEGWSAAGKGVAVRVGRLRTHRAPPLGRRPLRAGGPAHGPVTHPSRTTIGSPPQKQVAPRMGRLRTHHAPQLGRPPQTGGPAHGPGYAPITHHSQ